MVNPTLEQRRTRDEEPPQPLAGQRQAPRVRLNGIDAETVWSLAGSAAGGIALVWVLDQRVLALTGAFGFWLLCYASFLLLYAIVAWAQWPPREVTNRVAGVLLSTAAVAVLAVVVAQIVFVAVRGYSAISQANFWTQTMSLTGPLSPLTSGGMIHALVGSLEQLGLATLFSVPLGVLAAIYLVEVDDWLARPVRVIVEAMTALPEIIAGLFIYVFAILALGVQQSGFAASLALTVMMIPIVTRTSEVVLRLVPSPLREASYALGASQFRTVRDVVLPTARSGLSTAVILAMARAVGETSPVLLTSGFTAELNRNPFSGPQASLPLYIYNLVRSPQPALKARAYGAALALMIMVLFLFFLARVVGGPPPGQLRTRWWNRRGRLAPTDQLRADSPAATGAAPTFVAPGYPDPS